MQDVGRMWQRQARLGMAELESSNGGRECECELFGRVEYVKLNFGRHRRRRTYAPLERVRSRIEQRLDRPFAIGLSGRVQLGR